MKILRIITTIAILQTLVQCLELRQTHQLTTTNAHQLFYAGQIFQTMQLLGLLVIVIGAGACCWYFRGCFASQNRSNPPPPMRVYDNRPVYRSPPVAYQPNITEYPQYQSQPIQKNPILNYYQNQQPVRIKQSNPYVVTKKQSIFTEWDPIQSTSITSCGICSHFNKNNQIPMIQVQCMEDHCFHIPCISQYRAKIFLEQAGNGLNKCPKCKSNYSPSVKIHCPNCRNSIITVNLAQSSEKDTGLIDTASILNKYGDRCQNCRDY